MTTVLVDHDIEGQALLLWSSLSIDGWLDLMSLRFVTSDEVGLPSDSTDRVVWHFAQQNSFILMTGNRRMRGDDALERVLRDENRETSLPVVTIGNPRRIVEKEYREECALGLLEVLLALENYRGTGRVFIP